MSYAIVGSDVLFFDSRNHVVEHAIVGTRCQVRIAVGNCQLTIAKGDNMLVSSSLPSMIETGFLLFSPYSAWKQTEKF